MADESRGWVSKGARKTALLGLLAGVFLCLGAVGSSPSSATTVDAASIRGYVYDTRGLPGDDVIVDLFSQAPDGSRGSWLGDTATGDDGTFWLPAEAGCYVLTLIAAEDRRFPASGTRYLNRAICLADGEEGYVEVTIFPAGRPADISAMVSNEASGFPVDGVAIDLFDQSADGSRGRFLGTSVTRDGVARFPPVAPGCYVLTFIAPPVRTFVGGGPFLNRPVCVETSDQVTIEAVLASMGPVTAIEGSVTEADGQPVDGVVVDLFTQLPEDGSRGWWLGDTSTGGDGKYQLPVEPGCYTVTFIAPSERTFNDGRTWSNRPVCLDLGDRPIVDALLSPIDGAASIVEEWPRSSP